MLKWPFSFETCCKRIYIDLPLHFLTLFFLQWGEIIYKEKILFCGHNIFICFRKCTSSGKYLNKKNLFMYFCSIFWDVISGWYLCKQTSYWSKTVFVSKFENWKRNHNKYVWNCRFGICCCHANNHIFYQTSKVDRIWPKSWPKNRLGLWTFCNQGLDGHHNGFIFGLKENSYYHHNLLALFS